MAKILLMATTAIFFLLDASSWAAINHKKDWGKKRGYYLKKGVVVGGEGGRELSLLKIEAKTNKSRSVERVVIEFGDKDGYPEEKVGFFHVSVEDKPPRIVIDLAQVQKTAVDEKALAKIFEESPFVKETQMTMDPEDQSTNITLRLKEVTGVEVYSRKAKKRASQLILDLREASLKSANSKSKRDTQPK